MFLNMFLYILSGIILPIVLYIIYEYTRVLILRQKLPPGPFPLPVVGNHLQISKSKPWIAWEQWGKHYNSPMVTLWMGRQPNIIINDAWVAADLMEKHSSRPKIVVMGDMLKTSESNQISLPYGDRWRVHRRITHTIVGSQVVRKYRGFQSDESKILTLDMLTDPDDYVMSIERFSCSVVSILGWGRRIAEKNDFVAQAAIAFMNQAVDVIIPGQYWMESIPELAKLPAWLYKLPSLLQQGAGLSLRYFYALTLEGSDAKVPNFSTTLIREQQKELGLKNDEVANLTFNLIGGGVDTTSSTIISCLLAMCVFPEVQRRAQAELDGVVGRDRSPDWSDEIDLPYIAALVKENFRWRSVAILAGVPHSPIEDDIYKGYHIPAGTWLTANLWAIHRNTNEFPDPDVFRPERYLEGKERPYPNAKGHNGFGFGRRQCSGQPLAEQGIFISIARLLWAYNIQPGLDKDGNEVTLDIFAYTDGENTRPQPFPVRFTPRSASIEEIIRNDGKVAREALRLYDGETCLTFANVM